MSHPQFHSTKLLILRHAWLNLWDKHMTTGRINQVTTNSRLTLNESKWSPTSPSYLRVSPLSEDLRLLQWMFLHEFEFPRRSLRYAFPLKVLAFDADQRTEVTLFPDLTNFELRSPCLKDKDHRPWWRLPTNGNASIWSCTLEAYPRVVSCKQV